MKFLVNDVEAPVFVLQQFVLARIEFETAWNECIGLYHFYNDMLICTSKSEIHKAVVQRQCINLNMKFTRRIFQSGNVFHVSELRTCESFPEALNDVTLIEKLSSKTR